MALAGTGAELMHLTPRPTKDLWGSNYLKSHTHDSLEVSMSRGSLSIPSTILVNDIATGTTAPLSVATALSVQINPNTPSLTMMYIIRAF